MESFNEDNIKTLTDLENWLLISSQTMILLLIGIYMKNIKIGLLELKKG